MKKLILFVISFLITFSCFADLQTDAKVESSKHDYETYFVYRDGDQFHIYYKDNYGSIEEKCAIISPDQLVDLTNKQKESYKEMSNSEYFKHEYDSYFAVPIKDEFIVFYRNNSGKITTEFMTSINQIKYSKEESFEESTQEFDTEEIKEEVKEVEKEDDYEIEIWQPSTTEKKVVDGKSYWYVIVEEKNNGLKISNVIELDTPYFSITKAKEHFGQPKKYFIVNFIQVSKQTYEDKN